MVRFAGAGQNPQEIIDLLNKTLAEALADPAVVTALEKLSLNIEPSTPDEFRALISSDIDRWANLIKNLRHYAQLTRTICGRRANGWSTAGSS
jgi:tripartite-type tricarboxylate transporter receptor subunit TctC